MKDPLCILHHVMYTERIHGIEIIHDRSQYSLVGGRLATFDSFFICGRNSSKEISNFCFYLLHFCVKGHGYDAILTEHHLFHVHRRIV